MSIAILVGQLIVLALTATFFIVGSLFASQLGKAIYRRVVRHSIRAQRAERVCLTCVEQCREFGAVIDQGHVSIGTEPHANGQ